VKARRADGMEAVRGGGGVDSVASKKARKILAA
jgi:hypothetical protein